MWTVSSRLRKEKVALELVEARKRSGVARAEVGRPTEAGAWEREEEDRVRMTCGAHLLLYIK
jgi:hypothetical protein